jgi:hypothetical protein
MYPARFIQTVQIECLDHFLVFGEKHFDYLLPDRNCKFEQPGAFIWFQPETLLRNPLAKHFIIRLNSIC